MQDVEEFPQQLETSSFTVGQLFPNIPSCSVRDCPVHLDGVFAQIPEWRQTVLDAFHIRFPQVGYDVLTAHVDNSIQVLSQGTAIEQPLLPSSQGAISFASASLTQESAIFSAVDNSSALEMDMFDSDWYWGLAMSNEGGLSKEKSGEG